MKFFDCNCTIGLSAVNHVIVNHEGFTLTEKVNEAPNAQTLLERMDYCGIQSAMVMHESMNDVTPQYGNQRICEQCGVIDRLLPVWSLLPPPTDEEFEPNHLFPQMKSNGVKALYANPHNNRFFLNKITMGDLLGEITDRKVPLFLTPQYGYEHIYTLLAEFPKITIIVINYGPWSPDRFWFPLLNNYKNVYFGLGDYQTDGGIERIVKKFGSGNLLFGTNFPTNNMGGAIGVLSSANINTGDKEAIAHGNIERLLDEVSL
jgi:hypothetical protein